MANPPIDYADVQGTILRGYRVDLARHFILSITMPRVHARFIGHLVDGTGGVPRITTAARWTAKPECFVNIGFTCAGLADAGSDRRRARHLRRGVPARRHRSRFGEDRRRCGRERARPTGSAGSPTVPRVHIVLNLWVHEDPAVLDRVTTHDSAPRLPAA